MSDSSVPYAARIDGVARAAQAWRDPDHPARAEAVQRTLSASNRFTEEALAFAVNAAAHGLTPSTLRAWTGEDAASTGAGKQQTVAVVPREAGAPLTGLRAALAVVLAGHACVFVPPEASPALVPAFMEAACGEEGAGRFGIQREAENALREADAAIGSGDADAHDAFEQQCAAAQTSPARRYWRSARFSVAVLDGEEQDDMLEGLAEDALLHEGGPGVRLVWAPAGTPPDRLLEALARFRAVFPAHPDASGALQMQKAFLEARDQSHAHADGLAFLVSRGTPEVQPAPGHLRWAEYESPGEVADWLAAHASQVHAVVARPGLARRPALPDGLAALAPGTVHRQLLDAPGAAAVWAFAAGL